MTMLRASQKNMSELTAKIFSGGKAHFEAMLSDIAAAKVSIDLETFIFQKDILGVRVTEHLAAAAKRGVAVRVLVDGVGSPLWSTHFAKQLESAGAETQIYHPFPWQLWDWSRSKVKWPFLLKWIYLLLKVNTRNHRKVCIIDHQIAYIGSFNISRCHLDVEDGGDHWRDTSIRLLNVDLSELEKAFNCAWDHQPLTERLRAALRHVRQEPMIRLNHIWHRRRILYKNLLRRISRCKKRIWITNSYFVPDTILLKRLKEAASSGVDVRILLPTKSDVFMMPWASSTFYYSLLKSGVRIFEYLPSVLHAKSLLLDDWGLIGSSNLNHRSLLHDLEVDVNVSHPELIQTLENQFLLDLQNSQEIPLTTWKSFRPYHHRLMGQLVLYLKYWI
jgi:cardiolipin synthase